VTTLRRTDTGVSRNISVTANFAANTTASPSGDLNGDGIVDVKDALQVLRISAGIIEATGADLQNGDVAPQVNGKPAGDGRIDIGDAVVILRKAVGLTNW
jgi:hypothetical protein